MLSPIIIFQAVAEYDQDHAPDAILEPGRSVMIAYETRDMLEEYQYQRKQGLTAIEVVRLAVKDYIWEPLSPRL